LELDLSGLPGGLYILHLDQVHKKLVRKVMVVK
jgi:hypothetical protein